VPQAQNGSTVRFGVFEANLGSAELRKNGQKIKLQDQPFQVLTILVENPGEIVTREQFRDTLWPADTLSILTTGSTPPSNGFATP
jgi:DNA-binding winged helix-turn-helix (wHTH) protein